MKSYFVPLNLLILASGIFFVTQIVTFKIAKIIEPPFSTDYLRDIVESVKKEARPLDAFKTILERNIFNSKGLAGLLPPSSVNTNPAEEEKPPVPIKLVGTVAGNPLYAYAIIEDPFQRSHKIFRINDTIAPGVKLLEITRNRITISRDRNREEIELGAQETAMQQRTPPPPRPVSTPAPEVSQPSPGAVVIEGESVQAVAQADAQDMNKLLTEARLVPDFTGGAADGFRISSIVPDSLFDKIGLSNGDVILSINEIEMKDPEKAFEVYQMLKEEDYFDIKIVRAGQTMTIHSEIEGDVQSEEDVQSED